MKTKRASRFIKITVRDMLDGSEVPSLRDEIAEWRDNLDNANMSHLPKYEEVSECADSLDNIVDEFEANLSDLVVELEKTPEGMALLDREIEVRRLKARASRADRLGDVTGNIAQAIELINEAGLGSSLSPAIDEIEGQMSELDGVDFPGMY